MAWTYSGNPSTSELDEVRFYSNDVNIKEPFLQDEEILFLVQLRGNTRGAARDAMTMILAKLSEEVDYTLGPQQVKASQRYEQYKDFMASRSLMLIGAHAAPSWDACSSFGKSIFDIGLHDNGGRSNGLD